MKRQKIQGKAFVNTCQKCGKLKVKVIHREGNKIKDNIDALKARCLCEENGIHKTSNAHR